MHPHAPSPPGAAIRTVRPYGIDISSGIETDGVKDDEKIKAFTNIVRTIAMP